MRPLPELRPARHGQSVCCGVFARMRLDAMTLVPPNEGAGVKYYGKMPRKLAIPCIACGRQVTMSIRHTADCPSSDTQRRERLIDTIRRRPYDFTPSHGKWLENRGSGCRSSSSIWRDGDWLFSSAGFSLWNLVAARSTQLAPPPQAEAWATGDRGRFDLFPKDSKCRQRELREKSKLEKGEPCFHL
jgi:hypothetical protein